MYRILASLAPAYNDRFTALLLPTAITIDPTRGLLVLPHYDGEDLDALWSEPDGGAELGIGLASAIPAVLEDLARIDTLRVTSDPVLAHIPGLVFDHTAALTRSAGTAHRLTRAGLLSPTTAPRPSGLLAHRQLTPIIVNNGDFLSQKPHRAAIRPHRDRRKSPPGTAI